MPFRLPLCLARAFTDARHSAVALAVIPSVAAAEPASDGSATAVQPSTAGQPSTVQPTEWRGLLGASAVGSTYDWLSFEPGDTLFQSRPDGIRSLTFMSEFSPGPGFRKNPVCRTELRLNNAAQSGRKHVKWDDTGRPERVGLG